MSGTNETQAPHPFAHPHPARALPLSAPERGLLRALVWGEPLLLAAQRLGMSPAEARLVLSRLEQRAGVASRRALIARAVAHRWAG